MSAITQPVEREILEAVRGIKYGSVEVVIHDSRVVQVVRTERVRLEAAAGNPASTITARRDDSGRAVASDGHGEAPRRACRTDRGARSAAPDPAAEARDRKGAGCREGEGCADRRRRPRGLRREVGRWRLSVEISRLRAGGWTL